MNVKVLRKVRTMWNVEYATREQNRYNQLMWVKSVRMLGDKWLLASSVERKDGSNK